MYVINLKLRLFHQGSELPSNYVKNWTGKPTNPRDVDCIEVYSTV